MKISRELKTGIIVLGGILLFILGFNYLKSNPVFDTSRKYYALYDDVGGLAPATPVTINGLQVGKITSIRFFNEKGKLIVSFTVDNEFQFSKNSIAEIYDTGIIGGKSIQILPKFDESGIAESGDTLQGAIKPGLTDLVTQQIAPLQQKIESMMVNADSVLVGFKEVLDDDARKNLRNVISDLNATVATFKNSSIVLNSFLADNKEKLNTSVDNVANMTEQFSEIGNKLNDANLDQAVKDIQSTMAKLNNVLAAIEGGKGSAGKLIKDEELYNNLSDASGQLELLLQDMRLNPKRYVHFSLFGKRQKEYELPEDDPALETNETNN
ncbi:MlaD family protein [Abyssalbus ytuae]|uniref:MlaD family protein n=1 Tax=Abyssalbus ytuae TaxID=2926907 RepID=A0A9E6ZLW6_9FLAO|nr:MlaD family protein [Abyssalbus ytuae]UOB18209.1 MlaD family protein [Abyssalbus ytuae]